MPKVTARGPSPSPSMTKKLINLIRGWPSPHILPAEQLKAASARALSDPSIFVPALQYGPDPGYQPLREALAGWLGPAYGVPAVADRICITGGASQSIACILQSYTDPAYTRAVFAVAPCYFLACPIFEDAGFRGRLRAVPEDDEGIDLARIEKQMREAEARSPEQDALVYKDPGPLRKIYRYIIYAVSTCANPSGKTFSLRAREGLVQLARKYNALVICDDVYDFLQWHVDASSASDDALTALPSPLLPRLADIDGPLGPSPHDPPGRHFGHAISNGSFSKLVAPGVRTGWVAGTADFALGLAQTGSTKSGGAPTQLTASVVCEMLRSGALDAHLAHTARPDLRRRHKAITDALRSRLSGLDVAVREASETGAGARDVYGGYFLWLTLPPGMDAGDVAARALDEENLVVAAGSIFEVAGDEDAARFPRNLRLCYSWEDLENILEGVERLEKVLRRIKDGVPRGEGVEEGGVGDTSGTFK